jgi:hypothetical protein
MADSRLLVSDEGPVLQDDFLQRDGRLLVEPAGMRSRELGGECRKVRLLARAELELLAVRSCSTLPP